MNPFRPVWWYPGFSYRNPRCPYTVTRFSILSRNIKKDVYFKRVTGRMSVVKGRPEVIEDQCSIHSTWKGHGFTIHQS
uniref:Uncharacterized protein n=1 Tax=Caenorhabditis tropicalis TaxID=1561998 RepID=A0A1I7U1Q3_9PELO